MKLRTAYRLLLLPCLLALALRMPAQTATEDCRMTTDQIVPVIDRFNPFFTDHTWDNEEKVETARMDGARTLIIRQKACLRHHVLFSMIIDKREVVFEDKFWITEVLVMMKRVYFDDTEYAHYRKSFEKEFVRQFMTYGINKNFTFPVDDRTFICKIETGEYGARIRMESIKFLLKEKVKMPGISREQDDGWQR